MKLNKGFTLAEVLITLGIIGVVASLTVPVLMHSSPSSNKMLYRKVYSSLEGVLSNMYNDELNYPHDEVNNQVVAGIDFPKGFDFTDQTSNGATNKFCYLLTQRLSINGPTSCISNVSAGRASGPLGNWAFMTIDGVFWNIQIPVSDSTSWSNYTSSAAANNGSAQFPLNRTIFATKIIVDVNGNVKPNCSLDTGANSYGLNYSAACKDADQYVLGVRYDGKLQIGSSENADPNAVSILTDIKNYSR